METEIRVVRMYLSEAEHGRGKNLMQEILKILHDQHRVKGVTVFRGIAGFGDSGEFHAADMLRIMVDLPVVIEFFDTPQVVEAVLEIVGGMVPKGRTISWNAVVC
jgi:PII-like signaling protein